MSMYSLFQTDAGLERGGIIIDYGDFRVRLARAGGANKRYAKVLQAKAAPFRRAIQSDAMDPARAQDLLREAYADAVVLDWQVKVPADNEDGFVWVQGIENPDPGGDLLPFTKENVLATLKALPDLFTDLQEQAQKSALYRAEVQDQEAGN